MVALFVANIPPVKTASPIAAPFDIGFDFVGAGVLVPIDLPYGEVDRHHIRQVIAVDIIGPVAVGSHVPVPIFDDP